MEDIRIDSHKLIYHPCEVVRWLQGENIYPIEIEITPSGACNHRCTFCAVDYLGYNPILLDSKVLLDNLFHMHKNGLKSVICAGEGEPLINKDMPYLANQMKSMGIDVAMSTNGVLLTKETAQECLASFSWIRFSVAAIEEEVYQNIHRGKHGDLKKLLNNISDAVDIKRRKNLKTTLGVQCLLIPENQDQILKMAEALKEIGVDYFTIKPYSQHTQSNNHLKFNYEALFSMEDELNKFETDDYKVFFRANAMKRVQAKKKYDNCYGLPFMLNIDARGNVWPCINFIGKEEYCYGNIYQETFESIWKSERRKNIIRKFEKIDINEVCREACRLDEINKYLYELKHPGGHVNFI